MSKRKQKIILFSIPSLDQTMWMIWFDNSHHEFHSKSMPAFTAQACMQGIPCSPLLLCVFDIAFQAFAVTAASVKWYQERHVLKPQCMPIFFHSSGMYCVFYCSVSLCMYWKPACIQYEQVCILFSLYWVCVQNKNVSVHFEYKNVTEHIPQYIPQCIIHANYVYKGNILACIIAIHANTYNTCKYVLPRF